MSQKQEILILLLILLIALYLRVVNVVDNPGWFSDEGTQLEIARHFVDGRVQYLAVHQSVLLFSRLPLATVYGRVESGRPTRRVEYGFA